mgnify:FL=1
MPETPYDWSGKQPEKRSRQKRMMVIAAATMIVLLFTLAVVDAILILVD